MKIYTTPPARLKAHFDLELRQFATARRAGEWTNAWSHLERAHILGQRYPVAHTIVHWKMLRFGFTIKDRREILGQIPRLLFGGIKSFVGRVPVGNPGGANVPPLQPFQVSKEMQDIFTSAGVA